MTPSEFWNCNYREAKLFVESQSYQQEFNLKQLIKLAEVTGNKQINAGMTVKKPKNINLIKDVYPELFKEELEKAELYSSKVREGDDLINFMHELSEELKKEGNGVNG